MARTKKRRSKRLGALSRSKKFMTITFHEGAHPTACARSEKATVCVPGASPRAAIRNLFKRLHETW